MKQIQKISEAQNYTAVNTGKLTDVKGYLLELGPDIIIPGKVFGGRAAGTTGSEFSFQVFAPGQETGFLHTHKRHEELYFFLGGKGQFQVDGNVFDVEEGSVVRVAPEGRRSVRNNGSVPLIMLCVQYLCGSFDENDAADGDIVHASVQW